MKLKVKGEERTLNFGVRFVAELDESEKMSAEGVSFGMGLMFAQERIAIGSVATLVKVIQCALLHEDVTQDDIYDALEDYIQENDLETLFEKVEKQIKNASAVRVAIERKERKYKDRKN